MHKCVCDICGEDALPKEFVVPFVVTYNINCMGVKLGSEERVEVSKINLCGEHCQEIAQILHSMRKSYKKLD